MRRRRQICALADECHDGVLVRRLQAELAGVKRNTVFVLHMMGNHGPAYFRRYPPEFRRFTPDCATAELRNCSREQVVNAYDNAILYTDHVLAGIVGTLAGASAFDTAMIYVSDHGESLGENGLYLHGLPYSIAPSTQTHVPMVTWLSPGFAAADAVDRSLPAGQGARGAVARQPVSLGAGAARRADQRVQARPGFLRRMSRQSRNQVRAERARAVASGPGAQRATGSAARRMRAS